MIVNKKNIVKYLFASFFVLIMSELSFSIPIDSVQTINVSLIEFRYVKDQNTVYKDIEKEVFYPGFDRTNFFLREYLREFGHQINIGRTPKPEFPYFIRSEAVRQVMITSNDFAIWGHVTPYFSIGDYDLKLIVFTNYSKYNKIYLFDYELEIRDGRIRSWNNKACDLPESCSATISTILCYELLLILNNQKEKYLKINNYINDEMKEFLFSQSKNLSVEKLIGWNENQNNIFPEISRYLYDQSS